MWILAEYEMVALFSLKASTATGSGAKSLLVPTPYALKMALLDAACRTMGVQAAAELWPAVRDAPVAVDPPARAVVTNLFAKVLKPRRGEVEAGDMDAGPFQRTIAFREYVCYAGTMGLGLHAGEELVQPISGLLLQLCYLGKRGSFVQLLNPPTSHEELPSGFVAMNLPQDHFPFTGVLQMLDDCAPSLTFDRANVYSQERVSLGKERVLRHIVLPYRIARSSKSFTLYERISMG